MTVLFRSQRGRRQQNCTFLIQTASVWSSSAMPETKDSSRPCSTGHLAFWVSRKTLWHSTGDTTSRILARLDRKSTRLNSSHRTISYAVFCLKKKKDKTTSQSTTHTDHTHKSKMPIH